MNVSVYAPELSYVMAIRNIALKMQSYPEVHISERFFLLQRNSFTFDAE